MTEVDRLEPAIDPNNRITFLLDWELTLKCNLDCSYCESGTYGGHDNSTRHPDLANCLKTIDFMYEYVNLYMSKKRRFLKHVVLNVYGGESLHHPDIVEILQQCRERYRQKYLDLWHLTITVTTNAIVTEKKLQSVIPLVDEFTCSYHTEATAKQKELFCSNLLLIKNAQRRLKCVVLMHADPDLFADAQGMIAWCGTNQIQHLPRQLDHVEEKVQFNYDQKQVVWFNQLYQDKSFNTDSKIAPVVKQDQKVDMTATGRACCGGRQLCHDGVQKERHFFVKNQFPNWYCSVNEFFLFVKQTNGEIFVNKDCMMSFDSTIGPIGSLHNTQDLLHFTKTHLEADTMPVIQCQRHICRCGLCAPKAEKLEVFREIMEKYKI
jgi:hypothetical protein